MKTNVILYGLICLVIGSLALYLSYGPLCSGAWYWAFGAFTKGELFSIDSESHSDWDDIIKDLEEDASISKALRQDFDDEGIKLSKSAPLKEKSNRWSITDKDGKTYILKKKGDRLVIEDGNYHNIGGWREFYRLLVVLCFFTFGQLFLFKEHSEKYWQGKPKFMGFSQLPRVFSSKRLHLCFILVICIAVIYHVLVGPLLLSSMFKEALGKPDSDLSSHGRLFAEYILPYLPYMFYSVVMYILIILPMFIMVVRTIISDKKERSELAKPIEEADISPRSGEEEMKRQAESIRGQFINLEQHLIGIANKYIVLSVLLVTALYLELGLIKNLAPWPQCLAKLSVWVFLLVVLPYFLISNLLAYSRVHENAQSFLHRLAEHADKTKKMNVKEINDVREKFMSSYTTLSFILSTFKSKSVLIAVVVFLTLGILGSGLLSPIKFIETAVPWPFSLIALKIAEDLSDAHSDDTDFWKGWGPVYVPRNESVSATVKRNDKRIFSFDPYDGLSFDGGIGEQHYKRYGCFWTGSCIGLSDCKEGKSGSSNPEELFWYDLIDRLINRVPSQDRIRVWNRLAKLGREIGYEWTKDNSVRLIGSSDIEKWVERLLKDSKNGDLEEIISEIEKESKKLGG